MKFPDTFPLQTQAELEEFGRNARAVYDRVVRPLLKPEDDGKFAAIDPATGDYEVDTSEVLASRRLRARRPGILAWVERVGYEAAHTCGGGLRRRSDG